MKHRLIYIVTILAIRMLVPASAQTVIHGHHLGETFAEFVASDAEIRQELSDCKKAEPRADPMEVRCQHLGEVLSQGKDGSVRHVTFGLPVDDEYQFVMGKLTVMTLTFHRDPYDELKADFVKRVGFRGSEVSQDYANSYGARWPSRTATWKSGELVAILAENKQYANSSTPMLSVYTPAYYDTLQKRQPAKARPF